MRHELFHAGGVSSATVAGSILCHIRMNRNVIASHEIFFRCSLLRSIWERVVIINFWQTNHPDIARFIIFLRGLDAWAEEIEIRGRPDYRRSQ